MNTEQVKALCRDFSGVTVEEAGAPSNVLSFMVGGKKFAYFKTSEPEKWRFSIRVMPDRFLELTDQPNIKPARYMHRFHWVTIVQVDAMDPHHLTELITWSYHKAMSRLPKKVQHAIKNVRKTK